MASKIIWQAFFVLTYTVLSSLTTIFESINLLNVLLPAKGSKIQALGFVEAKIILVSDLEL